MKPAVAGTAIPTTVGFILLCAGNSTRRILSAAIFYTASVGWTFHCRPAFRKAVSEYLGKEYKTVDEKIMAIKTKEKWQWLGKLYPAVFTRDRQVLLMSMDKFLSRNSTIVEPSYMFYNSDVIKDAVIFIDEFDATKETMLKNIIENGLRDKVNYVELFKDIYASLHMDEFPEVLTIPSRQRQEGQYRNQSLESVVEGIQEKADDIFRIYSLQFKHRTDGEVDENYQNYMFQDHQFHSILSDKDKRFITMSSDKKQRINTIRFEKNKPTVEKQNIQSMLGQLRGFIKFFQGAVNILAINYMQRKNEQRKPGEDAFTMEYAIRSVLDLFRLNRDCIDYLTSQIMIASHKVKGDIASADFDLSFYENGFRYYAFENNTNHDMQSQIMMYSFQNTPEKMLLRFCEKAKVIGISATATNAMHDFIIKNFYVELPEKRNYLFFNEEEDFNNVSVSFSKDNEHQRCLCEEGSKLQEMLEIPGVKELFVREGWAISYDNNDFIMTPPLWNNIYKGALGEVVGKYLFERMLGFEICDITDPELFELFDFVIPGEKVYLDFKNWHEGYTEEKNGILRKISDKAKKCSCKCVIVANIIAEKNWDISEVDFDGVHILSIPYLVKKGDNQMYWNKKAWDAVRRCIDEYNN